MEECPVDIEPRLLDFIIAVRILRSVGGEVSIKDNDFGQKTSLSINLPLDLK